MFFSEFFLAKSGELSKYWLAAHMKIKKQEVKNTDIKKEIEFIKNPKLPLALRTTGHLLVGVARIYSSKLALLEKEARIMIMKLVSFIINFFDKILIFFLTKKFIVCFSNQDRFFFPEAEEEGEQKQHKILFEVL